MSRLESTAKDNQGRWRAKPYYCHGCAALQASQRRNRENQGASDGLYLTLEERGQGG